MPDNGTKKPAPRKRPAAKKETSQKRPARARTASKPAPRKRSTARTTSAPAPAPTNGSGNANLWPLVAIVALIVGGLIAWLVLKDDNDGASYDGPVDTVQVVDVTAPPAADPTDTPTETQPPATPANEWISFESEGGIPFGGSSIGLDVAPDELEVITAGPITVNGVTLPGGATRGSIVIFLPDPNVVVHYEATNVIAGSNWHGSYRPQFDSTASSTWSSLVDFTVNNMLLAPNCSYGTGCTTLDVLVVGPSGIIDQWTLSI